MERTPLIIDQHRHGTRTRFQFEAEVLHYTIKDASGSHDFAVPYEAISTDVGELVERNPWFRNAGIFWVALGLLQVGMRWGQDGRLHGSLWLTLGVGSLVAYAVRRTGFSALTTSRGRLFVIKDDAHDRVLAEIATRRRVQWRARHGAVDLRNDPHEELAKFDWLKEQEAISPLEYQAAVDRIDAHHRAPSGAPSPAPARPH